ncbi:NADH-quinone oxidoreductase subunit D [Halanaeroarchaeum sulfurireducens]|uniref:NADH-quinone oxidoreductase subunit C/D n=1 Tax=Halanaeroarchaeum sulfurireducens TaxID=1604004 RepID=A0A0N9MVX1_9EURY|nr:NADH-quinone oxidoreductase subunit D [Halanaeroarchaeum sulfurireducens]ALG82115.1 NADH-quinone oxidoreductase subunit C/D [Halanaeroarchaeum sulfurireducens]
MSSQEEEATQEGQSDSDVDYDYLESLVSEHVTGRESHVNAEAFRIDAYSVQDVLSTLKEEAGFDHLSVVTAQEYEDRFESIYHLKKFDDPTQELSIVVPTPREEPVHQSAAPVFTTADWHEREAYDLVGIEYEGHPDLRRILLPETWQGHPLRLDYNQDKPQIVTFEQHENPLEESLRDMENEGDRDTMFLNVGPHHPATHGVLHVKTVLDGEQIADLDPDIGYLHRCEEQMCQNGTYRHQIMPYPDRWDYAPSGLANEWSYARAIEDLEGIEVPEYAQVIRTMGAEMTRIASHMLAVATFGLDIIGDFSAVFMYAMRDREIVQDLLEDLTGQRMMFNYFRLGGVVWDLPEPRDVYFDNIRDFLEDLPERIDEYHSLLTQNELFQMRTVDTGYISPEAAKDYGTTGPVLRASGVDYDLRRDDPYGYYDKLDWDVRTREEGDNLARLLVRMDEVEESAKIIEQCVDLLEDWPEDDREIQANVPRSLKPEPGAEIYRSVEAPKGELGIYMRSDGTDKPARFKIRGPSFNNLHALERMSEGELIPDLIATLGSLDIILAEVDR